MSTEIENTEVKELQELEKPSHESIAQDSEYKIFDYFKEHTGLLVTCVSALVAIMSFMLHFAVGRMNYAYLAYWDISALHANISNQNEMYAVICSLMCSLSFVLIHSLLSRTSDAFRYYNKLLSTMKVTIEETKKNKVQFQSEVREVSNRLEALTPQEKQIDSVIEAKKKVGQIQARLDETEDLSKELKSTRNDLRKWVAFQLAVAMFFSYLIGFLVLLFVNTMFTTEGNLHPSRMTIVLILLDVVIYFFPAYFKSRCTEKKYENGDASKDILKLARAKVPSFPFDNIIKNGMTSMLSDEKLKLAFWQIISATVILLFMMSASGTMNAKQKRDFQIFEDDCGSYAVVYTSGSTRFMEEASIKDGKIVIDTTKQRVITSDDISYTIEVVDEVTLIRKDKPKNEQNTVWGKDVLGKIASFLRAKRAGTEEVSTKDAECVSGN